MTGQTLTKAQRLIHASLFREAFEQGRSFFGRTQVLFLREGEGASLRLGVVTSRKVSRRAVDRNLARRRLREIYRRHRDALRGSVDVVLVARRGLLDATYLETEAEFLRLARRAGLLDRGAEG